MDKSENYITVLIGIVMGMAIVRIVAFIGTMITQRERTSLYWIHMVWLFGLLILIVQSWWAMHTDWDFGRVTTLSTLLFLLISPTLLYIMSAVLCPRLQSDGGIIDLAVHHENIRTTFYTLLGLSLIHI